MTVLLRAQLHHGEDTKEVIGELRAAIGALPHILSETAPLVEVQQYNLTGTVLSVRVHCRRQRYWQVFLAVVEEIDLRATPRTHRRIRMKF